MLRPRLFIVISLAAVIVAGCSQSGTPAAGACASIAGARVRWIVPNAAGGGYDTESRLLEPFLERRLSAEIVIENMPGAGGIAGARAIADARPDGLTLGVIGAPGLLAAALSGSPGVPNPATAFTILARMSRSWHVWATGRRSPFRTLDDALAAAEKRPLVFAINEVGSANFASITGAAAALGVEIELVAGFEGTRNASLAAVRGDVDFVCFNFDTIRDLVDEGELRPLLQLTDPPGLSALPGVPVFGGPDGWAMRRARTRDRYPGSIPEIDTRRLEEAHARADALVRLIGAGRVIVAPPNLSAETRGCLASALHETLTSPEVQSATARTLDVGSADDARADVEAAATGFGALLPSMQAAMQKIRR